MMQNHDILSAKNETGMPVDWWFMYKISSQSESPSGKKANGTEYLYYDNTAVQNNDSISSLSTYGVDQNAGTLFQTLNQIYSATDNPHLGWFFYNDENPNDSSGYKNPNTNTAFVPNQVIDDRGHTKGVLAFDIESDSGFWLVQSTPKFPLPENYSFPKTGLDMAQTLLCVTFQDAATSLNIARQMFAAQQPNAYAASSIPTEITSSPNDERILLMKNQIASGNTPVTSVIPFTSRGGQKFQAIAKNKWWDQDFYNDLVGPTLQENLEVETWEHEKTPLPADSDKIHQVVAMKSIDLNPLGIPFSWSEEYDHAKLAISAESEKIHWVCVGDINFTLSQEKRGGGTVAFQCEPLWQILDKIFSSKVELPSRLT